MAGLDSLGKLLLSGGLVIAAVGLLLLLFSQPLRQFTRREIGVKWNTAS